MLHLPAGRDAYLAGQAIMTRPAGLARINHLGLGATKGFTHAGSMIATGIPVYSCGPDKPGPRGSNENTNGLLRQYLPKGNDLSVHSAGI